MGVVVNPDVIVAVNWRGYRVYYYRAMGRQHVPVMTRVEERHVSTQPGRADRNQVAVGWSVDDNKPIGREKWRKSAFPILCFFLLNSASKFLTWSCRAWWLQKDFMPFISWSWFCKPFDISSLSEWQSSCLATLLMHLTSCLTIVSCWTFRSATMLSYWISCSTTWLSWRTSPFRQHRYRWTLTITQTYFTWAPAQLPLLLTRRSTNRNFDSTAIGRHFRAIRVASELGWVAQ